MNNISRIVILFAFLFSIVSCNEDPTQLGEDLLPPSDDFTLAADSSTIFTASMILNDTAVTHYNLYDYSYYGYYDSDSLNLLGDYSGDIYGSKTADLLLRFLPPYGLTTTFPANSHADSLVLYLKIDSVILGNRDANLTYKIYKASKDINPMDTVYSYKDHSTYQGTPLGEGTFNYSSDSARIAFNLDGGALMNQLIGLTSAQMADSTFIKDILKGFYITVQKEGAEGALAVLNTAQSKYNSTRLTLYYNDTLSLNYYNRDYFNGAYTLKSLPSNSISAETDHVIVQGLLGPYAKLDFLNPAETWKDSGNVAINKVEIIVYPATNYLSSLGITTSQYPKRLEMIYRTTNSNGKPVKVSFATSTLINGAYRFNITNYYQYLLRNKIKYSPIYIKDYNGVFSRGTFAFDKEGATKLKILYSKIK